MLATKLCFTNPENILLDVPIRAVHPKQQGAVAWLPHGCKEYAWTWGFFLEELPGNRTRFVMRNTAMVEVSNKLQMAIVVGLIWGWSSGVMSTRMCDVIKALAERRKFIHF